VHISLLSGCEIFSFSSGELDEKETNLERGKRKKMVVVALVSRQGQSTVSLCTTLPH
jgi:hypothetical protein